MSRLFSCFSVLLGSSLAFAAGEAPAFFTELAALVVSSAIIAYLSFRMGLTPIIGFLLAGVIIGPNALGLVQDRELIDAAAEVGVILLLYTIGIEFSLETLGRIRRLILVGGGLQVGGTILVVSLLLLPFGVSWQAAIFTGCLTALSSTAIVMKLLADRNETNSAPGQAALGILIFQDLAVVAMVLIVPMLGGQGGGALSLLWAFAKAGGIIAAVLIIARRVMPKLLEAVARTCSPEIFLLSVIAICFGTAYLTSLAGVSLSLGAFLAGLIVSESRFGEQAFSEILPLQILFSAAFFISVGLLLDLQFLLTNLPLVVLGLLIVLALKGLITTLSVRALGAPLGVAAASGLILAQVGEFSFVLERVGRDAGLSPMGLGESGAQTFIACTVLLMGATPFMASLGKRVEARLAAAATPQADDESDLTDELEAHFADLKDHVIIAGYGDTGKALAQAFDSTGVPYAIATLSPGGAAEAESKGQRVVRGDYTKGYILELVGIRRASMLVIPDDQPGMAHRAIRVARASLPTLPIIVYAPYSAAVEDLKEAGASDVISADYAATKLVVWDVLKRAGVSGERLEGVLEQLSQQALTGSAKDAANTLELSEAQRTSDNCDHAKATSVITTPEEMICPECVAQGDRWVHLRVCMSCGHVGCCDSSKNKHARKHFEVSEHPVIKSLEKGDSWAWCYIDEVTF